MIIFMSDIICVTNRKLCSGNFIDRIGRLAGYHPAAVILREKDMTEEEYEKLARQVIDICNKNDTICILHSFNKVARKIGCKALHMPIGGLRGLAEDEKLGFDIIGASCHSIEEAKEAERLGCTYITAGHIFDTDCKRGVAGRGLDFLKNICDVVSVPVYAIGGISPNNIDEVRKAGAAGACVMSGAMECKDVYGYISSFER